MAIFAEVTENQYDRIRYLSCSTISVLLSPQSIIILEKPQNRPSCRPTLTLYRVGRFQFNNQLFTVQWNRIIDAFGV